MSLSEVPAEAGPSPGQQARRPGLVTFLLVVYLAGPLLMLVELLRPLPAAVLLISFALAASTLVFELPRGTAPAAAKRRWQVWLASGTFVILLLAWILASGIGGFTFCRFDYIKHSIMFHELYRGHLPIAVTDPRDQSQQLLHYYFAYYIAPVRLAQLTEELWSALDLNVVIVAYYLLVAWAALKVLSRLAAVPPLALLCLIILTGGFDAAGLAIFDVELRYGHLLFGIPVAYNFEWWGVPGAPHGFTSQLYWAPQHFFGAFVGLPLLLAALRAPGGAARSFLRTALVVAASALWSPYVAVGLVLIAAADILLLRREGPLPAFLHGGLSALYGREWRLLLAVLTLGGASLLYLSASRALGPPSLLLAQFPIGAWIITFLLNHLPFIVAAAIALWAARPRGGAPAIWKPAAEILLCGLLLEILLLNFSHGRYNDWAMRATLPVLLWMTLALCRLMTADLAVWAKALLFLAVGLSSGSALMEIAQSLTVSWPCLPYYSFNFDRLQDIVDQYLADGGSLFFRWLARQP